MPVGGIRLISPLPTHSREPSSLHREQLHTPTIVIALLSLVGGFIADAAATKALAVGATLTIALAIVANLLEPPIWTVYVAFVAIIAVAAAIATEHDRVDRGLPRKVRKPRGSAPHA